MNLPKIDSVDFKFAEKARARWDNLTKPKGSLGKLEDVVCQVCAIQKTDRPIIERKRLIVFAGDHGIVQENVSAYPQEVTIQMVTGFLSGHAAICVLAQRCGIELKIVDSGIANTIQHPTLHSLHIADGTRNFLEQPAMDSEQMEHAMQTGIDLASIAKNEGIQMIAGGEMGIGNTTSASAIYASLFSLQAKEVTGRGAGLDLVGWQHKVHVVQMALKKWRVPQNQPLEILRHFGGFEIACLTGFYLGAAVEQLPAVVDGFICTAAASIAIQLQPAVRQYLIFAHHSAENGFDRVLQKLDVQPLLHLGMRLGEGTGAAIAMQLMDDGVALYNQMPTFDEARVSRNRS